MRRLLLAFVAGQCFKLKKKNTKKGTVNLVLVRTAKNNYFSLCTN